MTHVVLHCATSSLHYRLTRKRERDESQEGVEKIRLLQQYENNLTSGTICMSAATTTLFLGFLSILEV